MRCRRRLSGFLLLVLFLGILCTGTATAWNERGSVSAEISAALPYGSDYCEPDYVVELFDANLAEYYPTASIDFSYGDRLGFCGQGITVGVIDSGAYSHSELFGNLLQGHNYIDDTEDTTDFLGHGTFVSGLIAAQKNNVGIIGTAYRASVVPLKCFDTGVTTHVSMVCAAIYAAVDVYHCQIINMSFGLKEYSNKLKAAIDYADDNGVLLVASVGNAGDDTVYYPAAFENVIGVGAIDQDGKLASFSQYNESVFLVAPGVGITGADTADGYTTKSGTSFSTPIVAGIAARIMCADRSLSNTELMDALSGGAIDLGEEGRDDFYGYGCVSLTRSLNLVLNQSAVIKGDANEDGFVDAKDLTALARHIARIEYLSDAAVADIDGDGSVSAADLTILARYVARIITTLD